MTPGQRAIKAATSKARSEQVGRDFDFGCKAKGFPVAEPEYHFAAFAYKRNWRFDRAWLKYRVAVEFEGGVFGGHAARSQARTLIASGKALPAQMAAALLETGGRHNSGAGMREDMIKYGSAACLGWIVIRVMPEMIASGVAFDWLFGALSTRGWAQGES